MRKKEMTFISFLDLPTEIILIILSYLEIKNLISCMCVCKTLYDLSRDNSFWTGYFVSQKYSYLKSRIGSAFGIFKGMILLKYI